MSGLIGLIDRKLYPNYQSNWDDRLLRELIITLLRSKPLDVLDLGAGAGIVSQMNFRGIARYMCGIDPDPRVEENPFLDEGKVAFGEGIPYPNSSFDLVFADNVLEHLPEADKVFSEVYRVLRPGGVFIAKTPNKWHYMPLIARMTPHWFHQWVNRKRGREAEDTFPTKYLANTHGDVWRLAQSTGFNVTKIDLIEGRPEYLRLFALTYLLGFIYERLVNSISMLARFRILLIMELQKPIE